MQYIAVLGHETKTLNGNILVLIFTIFERDAIHLILFFSDPLLFHSFYFIDTGANLFLGKKVSEDNDTIFFKVSNLFFGKRIVQIIIRIPFLHFIDIIEKWV